MNTFIVGNAMEKIDELEDESIDCGVTSSPYYYQRNYEEGNEVIWGGDPDCDHNWELISAWLKNTKGDVPSKNSCMRDQILERGNRPGKDSWFCTKCDAWKGDLGLEPDPILFVKHLCDIADKIRSKLKRTGTLWWNIGDKMNRSGGAGSQYSKWRKKHKEFGKHVDSLYKCLPIDIKRLPAHSHMMVPELFSLMMVWDRKWILKRKIIWFKKDYMCRSYTRNFTESWEPIFLFAKTNDYYFNQLKLPRKITKGGNRPYGGNKYPEAKIRGDYSGNDYNPGDRDWKNMNDVWVIGTSKTKVKHHATYPIELAMRCVRAGCPPDGTVLDPFSGIGQTNLAAKLLKVNSIGIELCDDFVEKAVQRYNNPHEIPEYRRLKKQLTKKKEREELITTREIK